MYDASFTKQSLKKQLRYRDFVGLPMTSRRIIDDAVQNAQKLSHTGFPSGFTVNSFTYRKNRIYRFNSLSEELVGRLIASNLSRITGVVQSDRNTIVTDLSKFLGENVTYRVYKLDVSKFYESVTVDQLIERLRKDVGIPRPTHRLLASLFERLATQGVSGLPRGLSISATLSEYCMRPFDKAVHQLENVFFYNRFVDDIIIVSSGSEDSRNFIANLDALLPDGLNFNVKKTATHLLEFQKSNKGDFRYKFDYLGYEFSIYNPVDVKSKRKVSIDISQKKLKRIKSRCILACVDFIKTKDFTLLKKRIRYLASNYTIYDPDADVVRLAGIFYNYRHVSAEHLDGLKSLDRFLMSLLLAGRTKVSVQIKCELTRPQRRELFANSFERGFSSRIIYSFTADDIENISRCWMNV